MYQQWVRLQPSLGNSQTGINAVVSTKKDKQKKRWEALRAEEALKEAQEVTAELRQGQ